jgi:hypothetical protein
VPTCNQPRLVPASTAVPAAAAKQQNDKDNYEKRGGIHVRLPRNAAYCAAWNSGFLTTFSWSSGSRNARGEMAHNDAGVKNTRRRACAQKSCHNCTALTSACLLSLKGSVASFWLCADDFRSSPTRRQFQSPSGLRICAIFGLTTKAYLYSIISSVMESTPGDTSMNSSSRHGSTTVRDV